MNGLQTVIEEPKREELLRPHRFSIVGSGGIVALPGLTSFYSSVAISASEFAPAPLRITSLRRGAVIPESGYRSRELEWRRTHKEALRAFEDQWVVLEGDEIVAHGKDPVRLVAEARGRGIQTPYVFYVEPTDEEVAIIGL